jgi:alkanesulfonate monooxygenase SsuD/methylene tetrahydromethanopterin reductase-like flavin-dependent oxidoreductase (luciferase family)
MDLALPGNRGPVNLAAETKGPAMRVSNFLFPQSTTPADDARVIDETLLEAKLTDDLGFDVIWLAEHHFDGICAYVDPIAFAAALATATTRAKIGFAVAQMALHHPIRMAEQISLIDHLSKGRLIVGLGRGTAYNIYDYQGFGIDHTEAQARFEEAEAIMFEAWKGEAFEFHGEFFNLRLPAFRPMPYTRPHPYVIRAAATEHGMLDIARRGRPFMMNVQSNETTAQRMELYRQTLRSVGLDDAAVAESTDACWAWRNVFVAETDAEAERIAIPAFQVMHAHRTAMRERVWREQGVSIVPMPAPGTAPPARMVLEHSLVCGSPATVTEKLSAVARTGIGGLIAQFRLGPMSYEDTAQSLTMFREKVMPHL